MLVATPPLLSRTTSAGTAGGASSHTAGCCAVRWLRRWLRPFLRGEASGDWTRPCIGIARSRFSLPGFSRANPPAPAPKQFDLTLLREQSGVEFV